MKKRTIFYSIAAQHDNLGDIEIRKTMLNWLVDSGLPIVVLVGSMPKDYIEAFHLPANCVLVHSSREFQARMAAMVLVRRANFVLAPGPTALGRYAHLFFSPKSKTLRLSLLHRIKSSITLCNMVAVRVTGGSVIAVGRSIRGEGRLSLGIERLKARTLNLLTVRDTVTPIVLKRNVRIEPDMAFFDADPNPSADGKDSVVFSLRSDKHVERAALISAVSLIRSRGLRPILVTQVKRDDEQHNSLAKELGIDLLAWGEKTHSEQMQAVKAEYGRARFIISDRLHALIFGLQEGAVPVALVHSGNDKLPSTLESWVPLMTLSDSASEWSELLAIIEDDGTRRAEACAATIRARERLTRVRGEVLSILAS